MALRGPNEPQARPEVGETLIVIHDFQARSSDELSLAKGDRVELIERDDEFGDGWFLGRHLVNGNTGLFPEVYTRPAPKPAPAFTHSKPLAPVAEAHIDPGPTGVARASPRPTHISEPSPSPPVGKPDDAALTLPLNSIKSESTSANSTPPPVVGLGKLNNQSQDSQVLNDTLNVINEHITDLRSPASNGALRAPATDSGSEYSAPLDARMSYIQGEETEEEEDGAAHTRTEVEAWSPDDVAEHLFTAGVEKHHCEVFRDQEISGEVLLGMDQSSLFIKAFDLGSVGRRLKTWHKIKALQDEVNSHSTRRTTLTYGSEVGSEDAARMRSRTSTLTNSISARPMSVQTRRLSSSQTPRPSPTTFTAPVSPPSGHDSPTRPGHAKRPSAASVRQLHQSRRHSSNATSSIVPALNTNGSSTSADGAHKKQPSFDRNWTLGGALSAQPSPRPLSSAGLPDTVTSSNPELLQDSAVDLDRGYFSGTEADGRKRNVLRKRDSVSHSRKGSYTEEQRVRSATALSRHSRFGSADFHDGAPPSAVQKYYGIQAPHRRTASTNTAESVRPVPPAKDAPPPAVTNLDSGSVSEQQAAPVPTKQNSFGPDWLSSMVPKPMAKRHGMRAISEKLTNRSKEMDTSETSAKESSLDSPARTGSSTPSAGPSFDLESPGTGKGSSTTATPPSIASKASRKKGKKGTSAYTRGLQNISPTEAKKDADYYGWMKKKSSNLMTTWKPRFFVLKGRRLAYYYSEDDTQEKGLIDISFHRVLPADNERLTGLHATITGVGGPGLLPVGGEGASGLDKGDDATFIFKLVPPRAGLSRAVNFTKPTVHYFAVPNLQQGRLWMAALMKATIDRDDTQPITSTYQQKTISLAKAKQMRHRPPALMNLEEANEDEREAQDPGPVKLNGLGLLGESDSGVSGMDKLAANKVDGAALTAGPGEADSPLPPQSA
ncbi:polar growth protein [Purpureocillium lilacinum]|uniref:polar growth protein n=1 Tax=Purpureocillium lilacinum TaxID=33203 RepID=UPI00208310AA|nr:polar growth protein [Purpureocillium lilacinum]